MMPNMIFTWTPEEMEMLVHWLKYLLKQEGLVTDAKDHRALMEWMVKEVSSAANTLNEVLERNKRD